MKCFETIFVRLGDVTVNAASDETRYLELNEHRQIKTRIDDVCEVTTKIDEIEGERNHIKVNKINPANIRLIAYFT